MKKIFAIFIAASLCLLVACGGSNTSSDNNTRSATQTSETGAVLTTNFESTEVDATGLLTIQYSITTPNGEELAGTIHWGDNRTTRIKGVGEALHRYRSTGIVRINVQLDDGSLFQLGEKRIDSASAAGGGSGSKFFNERESFSVTTSSAPRGDLQTQTLRYDAGDIVPTSDAEFQIETISADLGSRTEYFNILVNGRTFKSVGRQGFSDCRARTNVLTFIIPVEDLIAERNSNGGDIKIVFVPTRRVDNICSDRGSRTRTLVVGTLKFSGN